MKLLILFCSTLFLFSCSESKVCSFDTLDSAVDCACEISNEKEAAKGDKEILKTIKAQSEGLNESFEKALKDSVFTEKEFINQLKSTCENY